MTEGRDKDARGGRHGRDEAQDEYAEFALVKQDRDAFKPAAWDAAVTHRLQMPVLSAEVLDPGPKVLSQAGQRVAGLFLGDGQEPAAARAAKTPEQAP